MTACCCSARRRKPSWRRFQDEQLRIRRALRDVRRELDASIEALGTSSRSSTSPSCPHWLRCVALAATALRNRRRGAGRQHEGRTLRLLAGGDAARRAAGLAAAARTGAGRKAGQRFMPGSCAAQRIVTALEHRARPAARPSGWCGRERDGSLPAQDGYPVNAALRRLLLHLSRGARARDQDLESRIT
jgi:hypothetical protein